MVTKLSQVKSAMNAEDWTEALRIAARFPRLGEQKVAITRAWTAISNRPLYEQMGHDVDELFSVGVAALKSRYS